MARVDQHVIRQLEESPQRGVLLERERARVSLRVQVGTPDVADDEQRVAGEDEPRLLRAATQANTANAACAGRVPGRRDRLHERVAEPYLVAVGERVVAELDGGARGQVGRRPVASTSAGRPETWSACTCVSKTATIGDPASSAAAR